MSNILFQGNVQVQLYGNNALIPLSLHGRILICAIGQENSDLTVTEHRNETIQVIEKSTLNNYPYNFINVFNKLAWAEIRYVPNNKRLEIDLYEPTEGIKEIPILWMGTLENNLMPSYEAEWEILKTVDENNIAFCSLLKTQLLTISNQPSFDSISGETA